MYFLRLSPLRPTPWAFSCLFPPLLVALQSFDSFKLALLQTQTPDVQPKLAESFDKLMKDVSKCVHRQSRCSPCV
jgi:hypothetical protein